MVKKPSLSIHIELYIIYPFPNNKYWRTFFSFFHLRKVILPDFSLLGFKKEKDLDLKKEKNFGPKEKKSAHAPMIIINHYIKNKKSWETIYLFMIGQNSISWEAFLIVQLQ